MVSGENWPSPQSIERQLFRRWLARVYSNYATVLSASTLRSQLVSWFYLVKIWVAHHG